MESCDEEVREAVLSRMDLTRDVSDSEMLAAIQREVCRVGNSQYLSLSERMALQTRVYHSLRKLDILEDLLCDDTITEIMVNGYDQIFVERNGTIERAQLSFSNAEKLDDVIQKIVASNNKIVNASHPIVDTKLADGTRINIVLPPVAVDGSILSIRKFPKEQITMEKLLKWNSVSKEVADFLRMLVVSRYNIFVSGATSSGKTTFLNALTGFIPKGERVITIEDSAELQLQGIDNLVRLEAREATMEGKLEVSIRDLVRSALRMRPDRIIVGECRGKEAIEMLQAFGTGHDGSLSTGHANTARDMLIRLETMSLMAGEMPLEAIRSQIASGVDIIIHLGRLRDKSRRLLQIVELMGVKDGEFLLNPIYSYDEAGGTWEKVGELKNIDKKLRAGF